MVPESWCSLYFKFSQLRVPGLPNLEKTSILLRRAHQIILLSVPKSHTFRCMGCTAHGCGAVPPIRSHQPQGWEDSKEVLGDPEVRRAALYKVAPCGLCMNQVWRQRSSACATLHRPATELKHLMCMATRLLCQSWDLCVVWCCTVWHYHKGMEQPEGSYTSAENSGEPAYGTHPPYQDTDSTIAREAEEQHSCGFKPVHFKHDSEVMIKKKNDLIT